MQASKQAPRYGAVLLLLLLLAAAS